MRTHYILNIFKVREDRELSEMLDLGRRLGVWSAMIPQMAEIEEDEELWSVARSRAIDVYQLALENLNDENDVHLREQVFGALLADVSNIAGALSPFVFEASSLELEEKYDRQGVIDAALTYRRLAEKSAEIISTQERPSMEGSQPQADSKQSEQPIIMPHNEHLPLQ